MKKNILKKYLIQAVIMFCCFGFGLLLAHDIYWNLLFNAVVWIQEILFPALSIQHSITLALYLIILFYLGVIASRLFCKKFYFNELLFITSPLLITSFIINNNIGLFFWSQYQAEWIGVLYKLFGAIIYSLGVWSVYKNEKKTRFTLLIFNKFIAVILIVLVFSVATLKISQLNSEKRLLVGGNEEIPNLSSQEAYERARVLDKNRWEEEIKKGTNVSDFRTVYTYVDPGYSLSFVYPVFEKRSYGATTEKINTGIKRTADDMYKEFIEEETRAKERMVNMTIQERYPQGTTHFGLYYSHVQETVEIPNVLSLQMTGWYYLFLGPMHPQYSIKTLNFNTRTGELYELSDLFVGDYLFILTDFTSRTINQEKSDSDWEIPSGFDFNKKVSEMGKDFFENFVIKDEGLFIKFDTDQINTKKPPEIIIPYTNLLGVINPEGPLKTVLRQNLR